MRPSNQKTIHDVTRHDHSPRLPMQLLRWQVQMREIVFCLMLMTVNLGAIGDKNTNNTTVPSSVSQQLSGGFSGQGINRDQYSVNLQKKLRCLVCPHQTVWDSDSEFAEVVRKQIAQWFDKGLTETAVLDELVKIHGDRILWTTVRYPLSGLVIVLLSLGLVPWLVIRKKSIKSEGLLDAQV